MIGDETDNETVRWLIRQAPIRYNEMWKYEIMAIHNIAGNRCSGQKVNCMQSTTWYKSDSSAKSSPAKVLTSVVQDNDIAWVGHTNWQTRPCSFCSRPHPENNLDSTVLSRLPIYSGAQEEWVKIILPQKHHCVLVIHVNWYFHCLAFKYGIFCNYFSILCLYWCKRRDYIVSGSNTGKHVYEQVQTQAFLREC